MTNLWMGICFNRGAVSPSFHSGGCFRGQLVSISRISRGLVFLFLVQRSREHWAPYTWTICSKRTWENWEAALAFEPKASDLRPRVVLNAWSPLKKTTFPQNPKSKPRHSFVICLDNSSKTHMSHNQNPGNWRAVRDNPSHKWVRISAFSILEAWFWGSTILLPIGFDSNSHRVVFLGRILFVHCLLPSEVSYGTEVLKAKQVRLARVFVVVFVET